MPQFAPTVAPPRGNSIGGARARPLESWHAACTFRPGRTGEEKPPTDLPATPHRPPSPARTAGLAAAGAVTGFPTIWAQNIKDVTLRQFGTGVSNLNAIAEKVKQDLGFTLQMTALDTDAVTQKAVTQPKSYDVADIEYFSCKKVFPTGVLQPMDTKKIKNYEKIVPIFITGKLTPTSQIAQGTAPQPSVSSMARRPPNSRRTPPNG